MALGPQIGHLLDKLYSAPSTPGGWKSALTEIAQQFGSGWSGLIAADFRNSSEEQPPTSLPRFQVYSGIPKEAQHLYDAYYAAKDPWFLAAVEKQLTIWAGRGTDLCAVSEFEETEFYNDFFKAGRYPAFYQLGAMVAVETSGYAVLTILRERKLGDFSEAEVAALRELVPHLCRALEIDSRVSALQRMVQTAATVLDSLDMAVFALDQSGRCRHLNARAERLVRSGKFLEAPNGMLGTVNGSESAAFRHLIAQCGTKLWSDSALGGHLTLHAEDDCLHVSVYPVSGTALRMSQDIRVLVTAFIPGDLPRSREEVLTTLFQLTAAEIRVAMFLLGGLDAKEIAERMRLSYETVRFQLKSIFRKTGTCRQSQLVRLLSQLPGGAPLQG